MTSFAKFALVSGVTLLFWGLAWPLLIRSFTWESMTEGANTALLVLLLSGLGLLYRPDRAKGFALVAAGLTTAAFLGLGAVSLFLDSLGAFITRPRPL